LRSLVLTIESDRYEEVNNFLIPRSLRRLGHEVTLGDVNTLRIIANSVFVDGAAFDGGQVGDDHVRMNESVECESFDFVWLLDYAHPRLEREFFQIMWVLEQRVPFINRPSSMYFVNSKIGVIGLQSRGAFADTHVFNRESDITRVITDNRSADDWVIKPPNLGCGADVYLLQRGDPNFSSIIQSSTGNTRQKYEMHSRGSYGLAEQYAVLQRFIPEMRQAENRVIFAGGEFVGGYKKSSTGSEFRGNYAVGGVETALDASDEDIELCRTVATELREHGINYVGFDVAKSYIVEVNLVNPGGISGQLNATGEDIGDVACSAALAGLMGDPVTSRR